MNKKNIHALTIEELKQVLADWQQQSFHGQQIFSWVYKKGVTSFDAMSDLSVDLRIKLDENFSISELELIKILTSNDGTKKLLFKTEDGNYIEAAIIPAERRITGCISSQVGCKYACGFCASGIFSFKRNLSSSEMIDELFLLKDNSQDKILTHVVFMGIGEPLDNYDNVLKTIRIINSEYAFNIGARRITVSTCGIVPGIRRLAEEKLQIELSISLHAADDKTRSHLMPVNKKYPLRELIVACREYIKKTNRQITLEYVMMKDINLDLQSAKNLIKILKDLRLCKVNLIPYNPTVESGIEAPGKLEILFFRNYLLKQGLNATLRKPRGQDIDAACGQLRLRYVKN